MAVDGSCLRSTLSQANNHCVYVYMYHRGGVHVPPCTFAHTWCVQGGVRAYVHIFVCMCVYVYIFSVHGSALGSHSCINLLLAPCVGGGWA